MIKAPLLLSASLCLTTLLCTAQRPEIAWKKNEAPQTAKQDRSNIYDSEGVSTLDLMEMLDFAGVRLFKFPLEGLDRETSLWIILDEYRNGERVKSDTLRHLKTAYVYFEGETPYKDYIDGIRFFTRQEPGKLTYWVSTLGMTLTPRPLEYTPDEKVQEKAPGALYNLRRYKPRPLEYGRKTPMLVCASFWYDERFDVVRFCGVNQLSEGEAGSEELLSSSPHYFLFSYEIR